MNASTSDKKQRKNKMKKEHKINTERTQESRKEKERRDGWGPEKKTIKHKQTTSGQELKPKQ